MNKDNSQLSNPDVLMEKMEEFIRSFQIQRVTVGRHGLLSPKEWEDLEDLKLQIGNCPEVSQNIIFSWEKPPVSFKYIGTALDCFGCGTDEENLTNYKALANCYVLDQVASHLILPPSQIFKYFEIRVWPYLASDDMTVMGGHLDDHGMIFIRRKKRSIADKTVQPNTVPAGLYYRKYRQRKRTKRYLI